MMATFCLLEFYKYNYYLFVTKIVKLDGGGGWGGGWGWERVVVAGEEELNIERSESMFNVR